MKRTFEFAAALVLATAAATTFAQAPGYTGPSTSFSGTRQSATAPASTAKQLLASGVDDQYAVLKGKLIRHIGGKHYDFADHSGEIRVEISPKHFPANLAIDANTEVELFGKFDKERFGASEFEVKQIRLATQ
ncbi:MAG: ygiW [Massilia sp.]|jgi:uncharacterized protein (TIGR00156 family)|nr:ygiW [Massilia sp.]MDB5950415.1 ygiW [Massilia sp.]